ncbi:H-NS histone family protein [Rhodoblastus acidophilus]|uniref:H-NS histone family protein n=1 Tax=Candidatus Rhodoblastus alkanivorans TaxID=2954117 RepID=A0ABS9ZAQ4_9HYPH|nr:H-NS histone family protein [Candidatus Rhodoblastus alkanivorans]MCI4677067.1 H-NS histone family protein [Candidatus Rhodoblastus alkanivorans]MCI4684420.1 H-NS histone family protein [Candidatus Rhodoblastus alkanivorans]MDI4641741.1 H-NS histone family protein [Rhodoblastus acidophilus]
MRRQDLETMDFEELWILHEELTKVLVEKIKTEKVQLERRLAQLSQRRGDIGGATGMAAPRKYPKVKPKYRNPAAPNETWSGRGKHPRWLAAALKAGHRIEEFKIEGAEDSLAGEKTGGKRS